MCLKTAELCRKAVEEEAVFNWRPEEFKKGEAVLKYIPEGLRTEELCILAVHKNTNSLFYMPSERKTERLYIEKVLEARAAQEGLALTGGQLAAMGHAQGRVPLGRVPREGLPRRQRGAAWLG